jgi:hypothetical protein
LAYIDDAMNDGAHIPAKPPKRCAAHTGFVKRKKDRLNQKRHQRNAVEEKVRRVLGG